MESNRHTGYETRVSIQVQTRLSDCDSFRKIKLNFLQSKLKLLDNINHSLNRKKIPVIFRLHVIGWSRLLEQEVAGMFRPRACAQKHFVDDRYRLGESASSIPLDARTV